MFESIDAYIDTLGPLATKEDTHKCRLCDKIIQSTENVVLEHLSVHGMSLDDYNERLTKVAAGALDNKSGEESAITDDTMNGSAKAESIKIVSTITLSPDKPIECTICNHKFENIAGLKGHSRLHLGPKPGEKEGLHQRV